LLIFLVFCVKILVGSVLIIFLVFCVGILVGSLLLIFFFFFFVMFIVLFCLRPVSCVPYVASFSGLSILDSPSVFSNVYLIKHRCETFSPLSYNAQDVAQDRFIMTSLFIKCVYKLYHHQLSVRLLDINTLHNIYLMILNLLNSFVRIFLNVLYNRHSNVFV
jgi:hypothetical protein